MWGKTWRTDFCKRFYELVDDSLQIVVSSSDTLQQNWLVSGPKCIVTTVVHKQFRPWDVQLLITFYIFNQMQFYTSKKSGRHSIFRALVCQGHMYYTRSLKAPVYTPPEPIFRFPSLSRLMLSFLHYERLTSLTHSENPSFWSN